MWKDIVIWIIIKSKEEVGYSLALLPCEETIFIYKLMKTFHLSENY